MSNYEPKPNTGAIFKNENKEQETHADYSGSGMINGVEFYISAWIKTAKSGNEFISISFKPKRDMASRPTPTQPKQEPSFNSENEIPF